MYTRYVRRASYVAHDNLEARGKLGLFIDMNQEVPPEILYSLLFCFTLFRNDYMYIFIQSKF